MVRVFYPHGYVPIVGMTSSIASFKSISGFSAVQVCLPDITNSPCAYESFDKDEVGILQSGPTVVYNGNFKEHGVTHVQLSGSITIWDQLNHADTFTVPVNGTQTVPVYFIKGTPCVPITALDGLEVHNGHTHQAWSVVSTNPNNVRVVVHTLQNDPLSVTSLGICFYYGGISKDKYGTVKLRVTGYSVGISGTQLPSSVNNYIEACYRSRAIDINKTMEEYQKTFKFHIESIEIWKKNEAFFKGQYTMCPPVVIGSLTLSGPPTRQELYDKYIKVMYNTLSRYNKYGILFGIPFHENMELLANQALTNATYINTNLFAYAKDIPSTFGEIAMAKAAAGSLKAADFASLYLGTTYGTRLTEQDTFTIIDGVKRYISDKAWKRQTRICRSRGTMAVINEPVSYAEVPVTLTYKLVYNPVAGSGLSSLYNFGEELGLVLDWNNVWDLIPYSFVADWVVNIQDLCVAADNQKYLANCKVIAEVLGCKFEYPLKLPAGCVGDVKIKCYRRLVSPSATVTPREDLVTGTLSATNVAVGSSLIIQRLHK